MPRKLDFKCRAAPTRTDKRQLHESDISGGASFVIEIVSALTKIAHVASMTRLSAVIENLVGNGKPVNRSARVPWLPCIPS